MSVAESEEDTVLVEQGSACTTDHDPDCIKALAQSDSQIVEIVDPAEMIEARPKTGNISVNFCAIIVCGLPSVPIICCVMRKFTYISPCQSRFYC